MSQFFILLIVACFVVLGLFCRKWEIDLLAGKRIPEGKLMAFILFLRPLAWIHLATLLVFLACPHLDPYLLYVLPAVFFQQAFLFAVNDYCDREADGLNEFKKKRNVITSGKLSLTEGRILLALLVLLGFGFSCLLGWPALILALIYTGVSYAYSAPPFRLKGRVYWDLVSHGFTVFSYPFLFTTVAMGLYSPRNGFLYFAFLLVSLYIQVGQETRDLQEDAQHETNSIIRLGYRKAYLVMTGLLAACVALFFLMVLTETVSTLYLLITAYFVFHLYDLYLTWKSGDYGMCFPNTWGGLYKKPLVGAVPVLLWWILHL